MHIFSRDRRLWIKSTLTRLLHPHSIRFKLVLSNALMILIPLLAVGIAAAFVMGLLGASLWDPAEDMYRKDGGLNSVNNYIGVYGQEVASDLDDGQSQKSLKTLTKILDGYGYHLQIDQDGETIYSDLSSQEATLLETYLQENPSAGAADNFTAGSVKLDDDSDVFSVAKSTFKEKDGEKYSFTAIRASGSKVKKHAASYLKDRVQVILALLLVFTFLAIVLTDWVLTRRLLKTIVSPLRALRDGANRIAAGDLDEAMVWSSEDEIGEVCQDFEQMRVSLKTAQAEKEKYEAYRRDLIIGISHDLRTPLTSIRGYSEGILDGIANTPQKQEHYCREILDKAMEMETLCDSLSNYARLQEGDVPYHLTEVYLGEYLDQVVRFYEEEQGSQAQIRLQPVDPNLRVSIDIQEMRRVFANLFGNSIKYSPRHCPRIDISTRVVHDQPNGRPSVEIAVADDGPGVPQEALEKIFEVFYRTDASRTQTKNGSGIGLAVAKQIVEGMGGKISAQNGHPGWVDANAAVSEVQDPAALGRGLVIILRLPLI